MSVMVLLMSRCMLLKTQPTPFMKQGLGLTSLHVTVLDTTMLCLKPEANHDEDHVTLLAS